MYKEISIGDFKGRQIGCILDLKMSTTSQME